MIVYGSSFSPFVRKTLAFIAGKGLEVDHRPVQFQDRSPEFRACSPLGKIPGFEDGELRLSDSSAICHYVERKYPTPSLFPDRPEDVGRMVWFEEFNDTVLIAAAGKVFFNLFAKPRLLNVPPDMPIVERALAEELPPLYDYLEGQIAGPFLVGDRLTLADLAIACPFVNLKLAGHPLDGGRWPKLAGYLAGIEARSGVGRIRDKKAA